MSKEFEKALRIISKPPEQRQSHEIHQLVPWLRSKAKLFKGLKTDILADIIRNCRVVTKNRDDVVIKQGDVGDCFYITLNGKVTIYILNKDQLEGEEDDGDFSHVIQYTKDGDLDRAKLGNFVTSLGPGAPFGDVALTSGDSIRTASIISDERTDLLVVDRALYNRSMKEVLAKEFLEKTTFIKNNPLFSNWPPKYRKQLAMALYKETFGYESTLTRQGDRTTDMYFILRGQVEIQIDPSLHPQQYPLIFKAARENEVDKLIKKVEKPRQHKE
ncbi:cAMP-dependent protein kinase regulatory subunit, partial [Aplysia californica]|uniref:cAMP-dependent protein kinase regulatory subunit n=1 Tax=Aplysia californica TaxID=6500 RepID=A0ABM1AF74_APLCA